MGVNYLFINFNVGLVRWYSTRTYPLSLSLICTQVQIYIFTQVAQSQQEYTGLHSTLSHTILVCRDRFIVHVKLCLRAFCLKPMRQFEVVLLLLKEWTRISTFRDLLAGKYFFHSHKGLNSVLIKVGTGTLKPALANVYILILNKYIIHYWEFCVKVPTVSFFWHNIIEELALIS